jgi:PAS domain S-box-containing protein
MKPKGPRIEAPGERKLETQVILLSVAAALFAWVMQALLDFYFHYWGDITYPQLLLLKVPAREIYSRVAITTAFLSAGVIISRMVRRVNDAEAQWSYLYACLRALRQVNHLITHVRDRTEIARGVCRRLVEHRGFARVAISLSDGAEERQIAATSDPVPGEAGEEVSTPLRCGAEELGRLTATLPLSLAADPEERGFLEEVADDVAFALRSIRVDEERERRTCVQHALYQIASGLRLARGRDDLPDVVKFGLSGVLDTRGLRISLYDAATQTISELAATGRNGGAAGRAQPAAGTPEGLVARSGAARQLERDEIERMVESGLLARRIPLVPWAGAPFEIEREVRGVVSIRHSDGSPAPVDELEILTFVADQVGKYLDRYEAEGAVREQREQLQTILDTVPAYISYKDAEGRYVKVNQALANMVGIPEAKWYGKTFEELLPDAKSGGSWNDRQVLRAGEPRFGALEVLQMDGTMRWLQTDRIPYRDAEGEVSGVIVFSVDVTESREMEAALAVKEEELRQSQKMEAIGLLAGGIAHDFNNLLTAILGYAELSLATGDAADPIAKSLRGIQEAAGRAATLTRQLLAFSRRQALQLTTVDLRGLVESVRSMLGRLIGEDIELATECSENVPLVKGDPAQIEQIVVNLAVNARDAMPDGGTITIRTEGVAFDEESARDNPQATPGNFACLSVSDTGTGMSDDVLSHIFEPFFTTKGPQAGTGLGLSVIYGNVQQHGGWIDVETAPGRGTTFRIYFPETTHAPEVQEAPRRSTASLGGCGERILLVEDEALIRDLAAQVLRSKGYEVVEVSTAEEAIEHLDDGGDFDLLFSDVVLPGMGGIQLAEAVEQRCPDSRILLCSGYADHRLQWPTIRERGFPFLDKPYSVADLLASVRGALQ